MQMLRVQSTILVLQQNALGKYNVIEDLAELKS